MRDTTNINDVTAISPEFMGFIFYSGSKRYVGIDFFLPKIDSDITKVGVFVNEYMDPLITLVKRYKLDAIQLHGDESVAYCKELKSQLPNTLLIKAFGIKNISDFDRLSSYDLCCDMYILDSKGAEYGGNGILWNHDFLVDQEINIPFLLSGGIDSEFDLNKVNQLHKNCIGVDVNSKFEITPGMKNIEKLKSFIER